MSAKTEMQLELRTLTRLDEFQRCVELQIAVWGYDASDVVPKKLFLLATKIGGQLFGAMDGEVIVGFAMALPGYRAGVSYLHSHMLAVLPEYRNRGLGRRLKLAQREDALARGFSLMEWTFDPLEIRNAYLNIHRLGAVVRRYERDFYGRSSSPLQGGLPTDRLYSEWWLASDRVKRHLAGTNCTTMGLERVEVSAEIAVWKSDPGLRQNAEDLQRRNREKLEAAFRSGLAIVDFELDAAGNGSFVLGQDGSSSLGEVEPG